MPPGRSAWGYVGGAADPRRPRPRRSSGCRRSLGQLQAECRMLASNAGRPGGPAVPLAEGSIGPFRWAPLLLRRGPQAARGVLVWGHGYGGPDRDNRNRPTPPFVSLLNDNGWDVLRFDRHPGDDGLYASLPRLVGGLPALRQAGYRRILLGGQSRGGWQAIMAASERPDLVDAVIATAPAAHGEVDPRQQPRRRDGRLPAPAGRGAGRPAPGGGAVRGRRLRPGPRAPRRAAGGPGARPPARRPSPSGPGRRCAAMPRRASCASRSTMPAAC